ncbi:MAG: hypothetical protein KJ025_21090, partial [Burkholderiales bacterium]|nr:hypothetical protein [Burkholderiales bacterium]
MVHTIAGERLELTRFLPPAPLARAVFVAIVAGVIAGAGRGPGAPRGRTRVRGAARHPRGRGVPT